MNRFRIIWLALAMLLGLAGCGGGGADGALSVSINNPTAAAGYTTASTSIRVSGTVARAAYVRVINNATGYRVDAVVSYSGSYGSWFADVYGLAPGDNLIVVTADVDGSGANTVSVGITVTLTP